MAKNFKPYEVPLDPALAQEILCIPLEPEGEVQPEPRTIGERVSRAITAVEEANKYLTSSPLAALVADTVMRKLKKRGVPSIQVRPDGKVILRVSYSEDDLRARAERAMVQQATRKSDLPLLDELRKRADDLGVDISDLGRKRREIYERIRAAEEADQEEAAAEAPPPTQASAPAPAETLPPEPDEAPARRTRTILRKGKGNRSTPATDPDEIDVDDLLGNE